MLHPNLKDVNMLAFELREVDGGVNLLALMLAGM